MPIGKPGAKERLYCVACSKIGLEFAQRRAMDGFPTPRVRICPGCSRAGWALYGPSEAGGYYPAQQNLPAGQNRRRRIEEAGRI